MTREHGTHCCVVPVPGTQRVS